MQTSLDDDAHTIATWLTIGESNHDIALLEAPENKIHHFAFEMRGWDDILHAADIFAMDDVPIDIGPTRHGITRGTTIYFFDPSGNRNETFAGGYRCFRDRPDRHLDAGPARQGDLLPPARAQRALPHRRHLIDAVTRTAEPGRSWTCRARSSSGSFANAPERTARMGQCATTDVEGGLKSVASALDLLDCFVEDEELGVSEVARRLASRRAPPTDC